MGERNLFMETTPGGYTRRRETKIYSCMLILNPKPYTLNPNLFMYAYPEPKNLIPQSSGHLAEQPHFQNPKPQTPNPKPQTLKKHRRFLEGHAESHDLLQGGGESIIDSAEVHYRRAHSLAPSDVPTLNAFALFLLSHRFVLNPRP
jgi:hypothetical protein